MFKTLEEFTKLKNEKAHLSQFISEIKTKIKKKKPISILFSLFTILSDKCLLSF
jgi:hypothetical protein